MQVHGALSGKKLTHARFGGKTPLSFERTLPAKQHPPKKIDHVQTYSV